MMPRNPHFYKHNSDYDGGGLYYVLKKKQQQHYTGPIWLPPLPAPAGLHNSLGMKFLRMELVRRNKGAVCLESGSELVGSWYRTLEVDL